MERKIILNRIVTPDGTRLISHSRWDCALHKDANGETYFTDGGKNYEHRSLNKVPFFDASIYSDDPFEIVREVMTWGTYGKNGDEGLSWVLLKHMSDEHIRNIIVTQKHISETYRSLFVQELLWRHERGWKIVDVEPMTKTQYYVWRMKEWIKKILNK